MTYRLIQFESSSICGDFHLFFMPRGVAVTASCVQSCCVMVWDWCAIHNETIFISSQMPNDTICLCVQHHLHLNHCTDQRLYPQLRFEVSQVLRFSNSHLCLWFPRNIRCVCLRTKWVSEWPLVWLRFGLLTAVIGPALVYMNTMSTVNRLKNELLEAFYV